MFIEQVVYNGFDEIYVNAKGRDGSPVSELMAVFFAKERQAIFLTCRSEKIILMNETISSCFSSVFFCRMQSEDTAKIQKSAIIRSV